ncbi:MAG: tautomerase family protein [Thermomicrobiales bacterium]|nr:tautomerase family protein [Thermomicrobiales bacterium]MCO5219359.1 tautomerase family protein [Thermomicrobiales bacterium]MCO5227549.1 tautomerase family protein [Thermomicrobiales bacterium]
MSQFKIYGHKTFLSENSSTLSDAIHAASVAALGLPEGKRFHRFLPLEPWQLIAPSDRTERYLIIEVMMFEGRPLETKKAFYAAVLTNLQRMCGVEAQDIELVITESPRHDWLIRSMPGDELTLNYRVDHPVSSDK